MKLLYWGKDGGPESTVSGFWPIEIKGLFSIALLRFDGASREAYHSHAFNSISWLLSGELHEQLVETRDRYTVIAPSFNPIRTYRGTMHKVDSVGVSWVLTFRGPWGNKWFEYLPLEKRSRTLTHGRIEI